MEATKNCQGIIFYAVWRRPMAWRSSRSPLSLWRQAMSLTAQLNESSDYIGLIIMYACQHRVSGIF